MQYNVAQFLKESVGAVRIYSVDEETTTSSSATERVIGELRLLRTDKGIWASATLTREKPSTCSRCLSPFVLSLNLSIGEEYVPTLDVHTGELLNTVGVDEDAFTIDEQNILDLQEAVRQYELVSQPIKPLCKEDCAGLCPSCGTNLNEKRCTCKTETLDPRWEALLKLQVGKVEKRRVARGSLT